MGDDQPAGFGLDRRAAVADLYGLPGLGRAHQDLRVVPEVEVVGKHDEEVLVILPGEHRIAAVDAAREERHAFVLHRAAIERQHAEVQEILGFQELGKNGMAVVGGVSGVVHHRAVVVGELDEAGILDAVAFIRTDRKDDALAHPELGRESQLVVGIRQPLDALERALQVVEPAGMLMAHRADTDIQVVAGELIPQWLHHGMGVVVVESHLLEFMNEALFAITRVGHDFRQSDEAGNYIERDFTGRVDHPGAEFNRGNMAFARRSQAHHESQSALRHPALVRVRDHGWIE